MSVRPMKGLALVPLRDLEPSPNNPRERLTDVDGLAQSISEVGMIQPIIAQRIPGRDRLRIVAGHRRYAAAQHLRMAEVPVVIRRDMLPDEELLLMLVENGQRADLDPIEEARALRRMVQGGRQPAEIARSVGRHVSWVKGRLALLQLSTEEQEAIRAGAYTLGHAAELIRAERRKERERSNPTVRPVGRPKGARTKPYFGDQHPLAQVARASCGHRGSPKVGGVACGPCWESVIRADAEAVVAVSA